jgi:hypothetical protein
VQELVAVSFPTEPDFFQNFLSILSKFVILMKGPLPSNQLRQRLVLVAPRWHHAMTLVLLFELHQLFELHVPLLVMFCHGLRLFAGHGCMKKLCFCLLQWTLQCQKQHTHCFVQNPKKRM